MSETSRILFLRPDLVGRSVSTAAALTANSPGQAVEIARKQGWPGYIGSPRLATAAYGAQQMRARGERYVRAALSLLDGADPSTWRRISQVAFANRDVAAVEAGTQEHELALERQQQEWLTRKGLR